MNSTQSLPSIGTPARVDAQTAGRLLDLALVASCILWTSLVGKDLNWDLLNYHLYLPYSLLNDRLAKDFLPASIQSYLNPVAYVPFYAMVRANWPPLIISSVLAAFHGLNLVLMRHIACDLFPSRVHAGLALLLGALSPIFWIEVGTSFSDATLSVFVLFAVMCALRSLKVSEQAAYRQMLWAGVFLGMATALKLTMAIFAISAFVFAVWRQDAGATRWRRAACFAAGGVLGFLLLGGYWAWLLWKEFGNPVFPLFNNIFRSPDFFPQGIGQLRFVPGSWFAAAILPFEIATPISWVYTETPSPDLRYAVVFVALAAAAAYRIFTLVRRRQPVAVRWRPSRKDSIVAYFFISYVLWCITSANGRYCIPGALLLGVVIVHLGGRLPPRVLRVGIGVVLLLQVGLLSSGASPRWAAADDWGSSWFEMLVPARLKKQPFLYLSVGRQSSTFVAPFVHPDSAFVNMVGQTVLPPDSRRLTELLQRYQGRTRMLSIMSPFAGGLQPSPEFVSRTNLQLARFGLQIATSDCLILSSDAGGNRMKTTEPKRYNLLSCALKPAPWTSEQEARLAKAAQVMDLVESTCPKLFDPKQPALDQKGRGARRSYVGTDVDLYVSSTGRVFATKMQVPYEYELGTADGWLSGRMADFKCPNRQRSSPWYSVPPSRPSEF